MIKDSAAELSLGLFVFTLAAFAGVLLHWL